MISEKATIDKAKFNKVSKLKSQLSNAQVYSDKVKILNELGDEYTLFMADSATHYYNEALELCQSVGDSTGMYISIMKKIRPENWPVSTPRGGKAIKLRLIIFRKKM